MSTWCWTPGWTDEDRMLFSIQQLYLYYVVLRFGWFWWRMQYLVLCPQRRTWIYWLWGHWRPVSTARRTWRAVHWVKRRPFGQSLKPLLRSVVLVDQAELQTQNTQGLLIICSGDGPIRYWGTISVTLVKLSGMNIKNWQWIYIKIQRTVLLRAV